MKEPREIMLEFQKIVGEGKALGRSEGKVIFCYGVLPGETARVRTTFEKKNFAEAELIEIVKPSPKRVEPREDHYLSCSPWQVMDYAFQCETKKALIEDLLFQTTKDTIRLDKFYGAKDIFGYRTKIEYSFTGEPGALSFAFHKRGNYREKYLLPQGCALAPMLASQLGHLALLVRRPGQLDDVEYGGVLDATRALALLMLRNLGRQGLGADLPDLNECLHAGRHAAALRFMEQQAHRHDLDAAAIARGAGCSRTRLYEAFAAQGQTVMGALRELRLQRARRGIEQSARLHVGGLAWRCGFANPSDFSKLFRARFGLSPSEWHQRLWGR